MSVKVLTPSTNVRRPIRLFLAGTIDNGTAVDWQNNIINKIHSLYDNTNVDIDIYNPRDPNWDHSINPSVEDPKLIRQIRWELTALEEADIVAMYFAPNSQSVISLLETGLHMRDRKMLVYCPDEYFRCTNVRTTCTHYGTVCVNDEKEWFEYLIHCIEGVNDELFG